MSDLVTGSIKSAKETYKVSLICNTISSLTFVFLTAANMIEKGFFSIGNYALGIFAAVFAFLALFSLAKYRASNS